MNPRVALLNLSYAGPRIPSLASGTLKTWALSDPAIRAAVQIDYCEGYIEEAPAAVAERIAAWRPALAGFSCYVWNVRQSLAAAAALKARLPSCRVILGGPEAGGLAKSLLLANPAVDFVATGEGEETFRLLLRWLFLGEAEPASIPGFAYREGESVRVTPEGEQADIASMPSPYLEGHMAVSGGMDFVIIETSRGCPFTCSYCDWGGRKMRYLPVERVAAEFAHVLPRAKAVATNDADILMERKRARAIMQAFIRAARGTGAKLGLETNPVHLWPELLDVVEESPESFYFAFGLQSVVPEVHKLVTRPFDLAKIEARLAAFRRRCPSVPFHFSLIFGLPGDDLAGFERSIEWTLRWRPTRVALNQCLVLPGSDLSRQAQALGLEAQAEAPHRVLSTPTMSAGDFARARRLASLVTFVFSFAPIRERVLDHAEREGGGAVALLRRWERSMQDAGLDVERDQPFDGTSDQFPWNPGERAAQAFSSDPLRLAALLTASDRFFAAARTRRGAGPRPLAAR